MTVPPQPRQAAHVSARQKKPLGRLAPLLLIVTGMALLVGVIAWWQVSVRVEQPGSAELPSALAGQPLANAVYGAEAVADVSRLHGKDFPLTSGALGTYGPGEPSATLWVTGTPGRLAAARMVRVMERRIADGNSPFTPVEERQVAGQTIYVLEGMGQRHYYFRSNAAVIWLAADDSIAGQALEDVLDFYP